MFSAGLRPRGKKDNDERPAIAHNAEQFHVLQLDPGRNVKQDEGAEEKLITFILIMY